MQLAVQPKHHWPTILLVAGLHIAALYGIGRTLHQTMTPALPPALTIRLLTPHAMLDRQSQLPAPRQKQATKVAVLDVVDQLAVTQISVDASNESVTALAELPKIGSEAAVIVAPAPPVTPALITPPRTDASQLHNPAPSYPPLSRKLGESGRVIVSVYILVDGRVGEVRLKQSSGFDRLDQAAIDAVKRWRYVPARQGDVAIPYWYAQPVEFSLGS